MKYRTKTGLFALGCLLMLLVSGAIRGPILLTDPLWIDELHTGWCVTASGNKVAGRAASGNQMPLYFWLAWFSHHVIPSSEHAIRWPSTIASLASIILASLFVFRVTNQIGPAWMTGWIPAIDDHFVFYATEARPYAWLQLFSLVQVICFLSLAISRNPESTVRRSDRTKILLLVLTTAALVLTHITAVFLVMTEWIVLYWLVSKQRRTVVLATLLLGASPILLFVRTLWQTADRHADWQMVSDPWQFLWDYRLALGICLLLPLVATCICNQLKTTNGSHQVPVPYIRFVAVWGLVPIVVIFFLAYSNLLPLALYRYGTVGSMAFPIFCGMTVARIENRYCQIIVLAIVIVVTSLASQSLQTSFAGGIPRFRHEDWRSVLDYLQHREGEKSKLIFLFPNLVEDHRLNLTTSGAEFHDYLCFPLMGIYHLTDEHRIQPKTTRTRQPIWSQDDLAMIADHHSACIVARLDPVSLEAVLTILVDLARQHGHTMNYQIKSEPGNTVLVADLTLF